MRNDRVPPRIAHRFFRWFCDTQLLDRIEGDLLEVYYDRLRRSGKRKADFHFIIDVLFLLRPTIIRPMGKVRYQKSNMVSNYFTVAWRNILRNKTFSFINISGL